MVGAAATHRRRGELPMIGINTVLHPGQLRAPARLREDLPTSQAGPGQLLVQVQASSANPVDAFIAITLPKPCHQPTGPAQAM
jgi:hypothetical protein